MASLFGHVSTRLQDATNVSRAVDQNFVTTSGLIADALLWITGYWAALAPLSDATIVRGETTFILNPGVLAPAGGDNFIETALGMQFRVSGSTNAFGISIPAISASVLTGSQLNIGIGTPGAAFRDYLQTTAHTTNASDRYFNNFLALNSAKVAPRSARKARNRAS